MTEQEIKVLNTSGQLANQFVDLPVMNKHDQEYVFFHINAIQNIIFSRDGQRSYCEQSDDAIRLRKILDSYKTKLK